MKKITRKEIGEVELKAFRASEDCPDCGGCIDSIRINYDANPAGKGSISREFEMEQCSECGKEFLFPRFVRGLNRLADTLPKQSDVKWNLGYFSPDLMEILVTGRRHESRLEVERSGVKITYGKPTDTFEKIRGEIVRYDEVDHGFKFQPTLEISPGPEFSKSQRIILNELLAEIRQETGDEISCRFPFEPNFTEENNQVPKSLVDELICWSDRDDGAGVAMLNDLLSRQPPGRLVTTFRLLEHVVDIVIRKRISQARMDAAIEMDEFLELIEQIRKPLDQKLRKVIDEHVDCCVNGELSDLWSEIGADRGYNRNEAIQKVANFRNKKVHKMNPSNLRLPWEEHSYQAIVESLISLIEKIAALS